MEIRKSVEFILTEGEAEAIRRLIGGSKRKDLEPLLGSETYAVLEGLHSTLADHFHEG